MEHYDLRKVFNHIYYGNPLLNGQRRAWVHEAEYEAFEKACEEKGIEFVKGYEFQMIDGGNVRWYFNANETVTYRRFYTHIDVPIGQAINKRNVNRVKSKVKINGEWWSYN